MQKIKNWLNSSAKLVFDCIYYDESITDPRLDALFVALGQAVSQNEAASIESMIWGIWLRSGDNQVDVLMEKGVSALRKENFSDALIIFDTVVETLPEFAEGWNKRATANYLLGDLDSSISDVEQTLALEPRHFGALSGLGMIALSLGQEQQALEAFEAALDIHPFLPGADIHTRKLREKICGSGY
ncbi:MAG: hypothetical protein CMM44_00425 [Rhodospirillaceae bacterium]|nr:hypothetical protein [Rhodospirillaceae bacterium]|tara:strand:- start:1973 stop:2530 length:558 start_codon:yes stop_codon:yes gene_type:complete